ncbi:MAG: DUF1565 domain-containing protein [Planctomycetes bacterium]|nr:DUF1565 domain-containing protein [Planctomycetota bacterium]
MRTILGTICTIFLLSPLYAQQSIYVSASGNDAIGDGSISNPFRTVTVANTIAVNPSDRIIVSPGNYSTIDGEMFPIIVSDGVSILGSELGVTTIDGENVLTPIFVLTDSSFTTIFQDLRIIGDGNILEVFGNPADLQVINCTLIGGKRGINRDFAGSDSSLLVDNCNILDMSEYGILWKLIGAAPGVHSLAIRDSIIQGKNLSMNGIQIDGGGFASFALDITNNSVQGFDNGLLISHATSSSDILFTGNIERNSLFKNDSNGIDVDLSASAPGPTSISFDVLFKYNLLEKNDRDGGNFSFTADGVSTAVTCTSTFIGNTFQDNDKSGLHFDESERNSGICTVIPDLGGGANNSPGGNTFVSNDNDYLTATEFDLRVDSNENISAKYNWWSITNTSDLLSLTGFDFDGFFEQHILHSPDNPVAGTVDYSDYLIGDIEFKVSPQRVIGNGKETGTMVALNNSVLIPYSGIEPASLNIEDIAILDLQVSSDSSTIFFTVPSVSLTGAGIRDITLEYPAGQEGTSTLSVVANSNEGRLECFIATAAFGTSSSLDLDILREWRDDVLLQSPNGRQLVNLYYQVSPFVAQAIEHHPNAKRFVRDLLRPLISIISNNAG